MQAARQDFDRERDQKAAREALRAQQSAAEEGSHGQQTEARDAWRKQRPAARAASPGQQPAASPTQGLVAPAASPVQQPAAGQADAEQAETGSHAARAPVEQEAGKEADADSHLSALAHILLQARPGRQPSMLLHTASHGSLAGGDPHARMLRYSALRSGRGVGMLQDGPGYSSVLELPAVHPGK